MVSSWIDLLSPEAVRILEYVAWGTLLTAITLWTLGVVIARVGVAIVAGGLGAAAAALLVQNHGHQTVLAAAGVGFALGALVGALGFKVVQAISLAVVLGTAVAGLYYHWHVEAIASPPAPTAIVTTQSIEALQIPTDTWKARQAMTFESLALRIKDQFMGTSARHLRHMLLAAAGAAVIALLIAFAFPRFTTAVVTSVAGAALILAALRILVQIHYPHQAGIFPHHAWSRYCTLVVVAGVGFLIQYRIFLGPPDNTQKMETPQKAHA